MQQQNKLQKSLPEEIKLTEKFDKFDKWSYLDCNCNRRIKNDAPDEIKAQPKKADEEYFNRTGRHMLKIDY